MKIKFKLLNDGHVQIYATYPNLIEEEEVLIGDIFSETGSLESYSGKNSIQICGFDHMKGLWSCGRFNHSQDCCLVWNDIKPFLEKKSGGSNGNK